MTTDGHEVNVVVIDIDGDLAHSLSCVCVEEDLALSAHLAYLLCGLDDACMLKWGQMHDYMIPMLASKLQPCIMLQSMSSMQTWQWASDMTGHLT